MKLLHENELGGGGGGGDFCLLSSESESHVIIGG